MMDSFGPPLSTAMIGVPNFMASTGTIPKCSKEGVYNNISDSESNNSFKLEEIEVRTSFKVSDFKWSEVVLKLWYDSMANSMFFFGSNLLILKRNGLSDMNLSKMVFVELEMTSFSRETHG
ncbi:hypothetical protein WICPIJ_005302 [Wickerhamomyces pijperi]|uniref:Uncharacterized protein n=1 Tax=Wickerhamomyces pijperi TaxID=599730 RepID=A0A9P8Q467_WICPI|nr:hypothetical protein WICPIJ_005302 [Wickerhamomyces pijperi]